MNKEKALRRAQLALRIATLTTFAMLALSLFLIGNGVVAAAQGGEMAAGKAMAFIGAGLAVGLAGIGGGYAVGQAGAAMIAALTEKPELFGRMFIVLVLGEGIALYGLLMAILLWISGSG